MSIPLKIIMRYPFDPEALQYFGGLDIIKCLFDVKENPQGHVAPKI